MQHLLDPDLWALLPQIDPASDRPRDSDAIDWADLADRIHFIVDLFRCYTDSADLFEPSFTQQQTVQLKPGHLPAEQL